MDDTPKKNPPSKPRNNAPQTAKERMNHGRSANGRERMEKFAEVLSTMPIRKGRITDAAQIAFPNQTRRAAQITGSRLTREPIVQQMIRERLDRAAKASGITRQEVVGMLAEMARASLKDVLNSKGELDWKVAAERGVDHLIKEVTVVERHSKDGSKRKTTTFKLNDRQNAMDLLSELMGWKREAAKNPLDGAREAFQIMRQKDRYADVDDKVLAELVSEHVDGVTAADILEGK